MNFDLSAMDGHLNFATGSANVPNRPASFLPPASASPRNTLAGNFSKTPPARIHPAHENTINDFFAPGLAYTWSSMEL